ncbi:hypothetical protein K488DRAFT_75370, partial [Vararia minispora EC-137]
PSLREALLEHLAKLLPSDEKPGTSHSLSTRVNRSVRHTGTFSTADAAVSSARLEQKRVLTESQAAPSSYVTVLRPTVGKEASEVVLAKVSSIYTTSGARGAAHGYVDSVSSIEELSYIAVQAYKLSHGAIFTSLACPECGCMTFLRIPHTHVIFSFSTASFTSTAVGDNWAFPITLVTADDFTMELLRRLWDRTGDVQAAVKFLNSHKRMTMINHGGASSGDEGGDESDAAHAGPWEQLDHGPYSYFFVQTESSYSLSDLLSPATFDQRADGTLVTGEVRSGVQTDAVASDVQSVQGLYYVYYLCLFVHLVTINFVQQF